MTNKTTNEEAFEAYIEQQLVSLHGYNKGNPADFDRQAAINTAELWAFLEATQAKEIARMAGTKDRKGRIVQVLKNRIDEFGTLDVLKGGLAVENIRLTLFYPKPSASDGDTARKNYAQNRWTVTRQQTFATTAGHEGQEIDMVIFVNGLPLITMELKKPSQGQTAAVHGTRQYRTDRDPKEPLLRFGRCLAHMAVDTGEVWMTTRLEEKKTYFMPFNRGLPDGKGAGNPPVEDDFATSYLWCETLSPSSLANIISNFAMIDFGETKSGKKLTDRRLRNAQRLIFPRYHQTDAVARLCRDTEQRGVGGRYLIQHSAGSGKSNTITWLAYRLNVLCATKGANRRGKQTVDHLFDSVIIVTDRRALDSQILGYIRTFGHSENTYAHAETAKDLRELIENGKHIIVTTIEKFPFMCDTIGDMTKKNFAIIIDEAHSSQSGTAAQAMNTAMGHTDADSSEETEEQDDDCKTTGTDEIVEQVIRNRKMSENASFYAFTATPKPQTLEQFGRKDEAEQFHPFHLYSMKQAIEEGFILDVTTSYTTYRSFYQLIKTTTDNPSYDSDKAQALLKKYVEQQPEAIAGKAKIMLTHFNDEVFNRKALGGKARAMVVTHNIRCAIEYYRALTKLCTEWRLNYRPLIAFSGKKNFGGEELSEEKINGFSSAKTTEQFDKDDTYRILVVANKHITGYDQPKLCAMYVDKKLRDVQAVQTLSRLNRCAPELGKTAKSLKVIDFYNDTDDIEKAFSAYYTGITLVRGTDVQTLHDLRGMILDSGMLTEEEINAFADKYYRGAQESEYAHIITTAADRFNNTLNLSDEDKGLLKMRCKRFVKIYLRVMPIIEYEMAEWDKLCSLLRLLLPQMHAKSSGGDEDLAELLRKVQLAAHRSIRQTGKDMTLSTDTTEMKPKGTGKGGPGSDSGEQLTLDDLLKTFNDKYAGAWPVTDDEKKAKINALADSVAASDDYNTKVKNNTDTQQADAFLGQLIMRVLLDSRKDEQQLYKSYRDNKDFAADLNDIIKQIMAVRGGARF